MKRLKADDAHAPGTYADGIQVCLESHSVDGIDSPVPRAERLPDLRLADPPGTDGARLPIAEAEHVVTSTGRHNGME
jgi:hypothetical protein